MEDVSYGFNQRGYGTHQAISDMVTSFSRVLDVGCASGYLMEHLRRTKKCECVGIEPNPVAAGRAAALGFEVIPEGASSAVNSERLTRLKKQFDYVVFGDVLEHMINPLEVLRTYKSLLCSEGTIIVSLPNIVSLRARVRIACGIWQYDDMGIFDRTHIRFFTIKTGRDLIAEAGLTSVQERFVGPLTWYGGRSLQIITKLRPQLLANNMILAARVSE